jgi:hypothetical protein
MSLIAALTSQLNAVALLLEEIAATQGSRRKVAYAELIRRAAAYAWVDANIVLPALRRARWKGVRSDVLTATVQFQSALADLLVTNPDGPVFAESLNAFRRAVAALAASVIGGTLAGAVREADLDGDPLALSEVGRAFDAPPRGLPFDLSRARQLVTDAAIVLAALQGSDPRAAHTADSA